MNLGWICPSSPRAPITVQMQGAMWTEVCVSARAQLALHTLSVFRNRASFPVFSLGCDHEGRGRVGVGGPAVVCALLQVSPGDTGWDFADYQGSPFVLKAGTSEYRGLLANYMELICKNPGAMFEISNAGENA